MFHYGNVANGKFQQGQFKEKQTEYGKPLPVSNDLKVVEVFSALNILQIRIQVPTTISLKIIERWKPTYCVSETRKQLVKYIQKPKIRYKVI